MSKIPLRRVPTSIPISCMPLNKNFITLESRIKTFDETFKDDLKPKELAEGGLFFVHGSDMMCCFNCGHSTSLTDSFIFHSKLCTFIPDSVPLLPRLRDMIAELAENTESAVNDINQQGSSDIAKNTVSHKNKCIWQFVTFLKRTIYTFVNDCIGSSSIKNGDMKMEMCENEVLEDDDVDPHSLEQLEQLGLFWECVICGKDEDIKLSNMPCHHRTYCLSCIKNVTECSYCKKEVISCFPVFFA